MVLSFVDNLEQIQYNANVYCELKKLTTSQLNLLSITAYNVTGDDADIPSPKLELPMHSQSRQTTLPQMLGIFSTPSAGLQIGVSFSLMDLPENAKRAPSAPV